MCQTGNYRERGIKGLDGYQTEFAVDASNTLFGCPRNWEAVGVI